MADEKKPDYRKVWGHGYRTGYQYAIDAGEPMKQAKLNRMIHEQTLIAQKIFKCVPKSAVWSKKEIHTEAFRQGIQQSIKVIDGCLHSLKQSGLIKEPTRGYFTQVSATPDASSPKLKSVVATPQPEQKTMTKETSKPDPFELIRAKIVGLDMYIKEVADKINETCSDMMKTLDEAELKCMEKEDGVDDELKKLRALKQAMQALSTDE